MSEHDYHNKYSVKEEVFLKTIQNRVGSKLDELEKNNHSQKSLLFTLKNEIDNLIEAGTKTLEGISNNVDLQNGLSLASNINIKRKDCVLSHDGETKTNIFGKIFIEENKTKLTQENSKSSEKTALIEKKEISIKAQESKLQKKSLSPAESKADKIVSSENEDSIVKNSKKENESVATDKMSKESQQEQKKEKKDEHQDNSVVNSISNLNQQITFQEDKRLLNRLEKCDRANIALMNSPPYCIRKVLEAVCIILGEELFWENVQKVANSEDFPSRISGLKIESLSKDAYERVKCVLNEQGMQLEDIGKVSLTAKYLAEWLTEFITLAELNNKYQTKVENEPKTNENLGKIHDREAFKKEDIFSEKFLKQIALEKEYEHILGSFEKKFLCEFMSYVKPPEQVRRLMEAICTILGEKTVWNNVRKMLVDFNFIRRLLEAKASLLPYKAYKKVKYILDEEGMDIDNIARISYPAKSFLQCATILVRLRELVRGYDPTPEEEAEEMHLIALQEQYEQEREAQDIIKLENMQLSYLEADLTSQQENETPEKPIEETKKAKIINNKQ